MYTYRILSRCGIFSLSYKLFAGLICLMVLNMPGLAMESEGNGNLYDQHAESATARVLSRPAFIDLSSSLSESAVLIELKHYPQDEVRFRLFSGSQQHHVWDAISESYISSQSYGAGARVPGFPTESTRFWAVFRRGSLMGAQAVYRDRLGPDYMINHISLDLPEAYALDEHFLLSACFEGAAFWDLSQKYVVLAFSDDDLMVAGSTQPGDGCFLIPCPAGVPVTRIEIRSLGDETLAHAKGYWTEDAYVFEPFSYFLARATDADRIGLYAGMGEAGEELVIVYGDTDAFATPQGPPPLAGMDFAGGTLLYHGVAGELWHDGLSPEQDVYYRAWVYTAGSYSEGITAHARTLATMPQAHPQQINMEAASSISIEISWQDSGADGYLVLLRETEITEDELPDNATFLRQDARTRYVQPGEQPVIFDALRSEQLYYASLIPFNGSGSSIHYLKQGAWKGEATTPAGSNISDHFRSRDDGLWHDPHTWESSPDGQNWDISTIYPRLGAAFITISPGHQLVLSRGISVNRLDVHGELRLQTDNEYLRIEAGEGPALRIRQGGMLINAATGSASGLELAGGLRWQLEGGGTYVHNTTRSVVNLLNSLDQYPGSTFVYLGSESLTPSRSISGRSYYRLKFLSASGQWSASLGTGAQPLEVVEHLEIGSGVEVFSGSFQGELRLLGSMELKGRFITSDRHPQQLLMPGAGQLKIHTGAELVLSPQSRAFFSGKPVIENGGWLWLMDDEQGSASLIHDSEGVAARVLARSIEGQNGWQMFSSAVQGQPIGEMFMPDEGHDNYLASDFYLWHEPEGLWVNRKNTLDSPSGDAPWFDQVNPGLDFVALRGYLAAYQWDQQGLYFEGFLNQGPQQIMLQAEGTAFRGFNLLGNPYPSYLDWKAEQGWMRENLKAEEDGYALYVWNPEVQNYGVYLSDAPMDQGTNGASRFIAPGQAFFVQAESQGWLQLSDAARCHGPSAQSKETEPVSPTIKLRLSEAQGTASDEALLVFGHPRPGSGADKWMSLVEQAPSLWFQEDDRRYSWLNAARPGTEKAYNLVFQTGKKGWYTLEAFYDPLLFDGVYLFDETHGSLIETGPGKAHTFFSPLQEKPVHWRLYTQRPEHAGAHFEVPLAIYKNGYLHIIPGSSFARGQLELFDLSGRRLSVFNLESDTRQLFPFSAPAGIYLLRFTHKQRQYSSRLLIL